MCFDFCRSLQFLSKIRRVIKVWPLANQQSCALCTPDHSMGGVSGAAHLLCPEKEPGKGARLCQPGRNWRKT